MQCATAAAQCCARALRAAQGAGWVHCDLRPSNIVVRPGSSCSAVLVDWGSARKAKDDCLGEGVAVFAHARTRGRSGCKAHAGLDACALLLTWVGTAWHERCDAPWEDRQPGLFEGRQAWLEERAARHAELRVVLCALLAIDRALQGGAAQAGAALDAAEAALGDLLAMHGELPPTQ
jgi:serine/threonine protein kinase